MNKTWKRIVSVIMALAMVVLCLPGYASPVKTAKAEATQKTVYVLTDTISTGEYLFVNRNTAGSGTAMTTSSDGTSISTATVNVQTSQDEHIGVGVLYIDPDAAGFPADAVWNAAVEDQNMRVKKGGYYLQFSEANAGGNTHSLVLSSTTQSENERYSAFSWRCDSNKLHVEYHNNNNGHDGDRYIQLTGGRYNNPYLRTL